MLKKKIYTVQQSEREKSGRAYKYKLHGLHIEINKWIRIETKKKLYTNKWLTGYDVSWPKYQAKSQVVVPATEITAKSEP